MWGSYLSVLPIFSPQVCEDVVVEIRTHLELYTLFLEKETLATAILNADGQINCRMYL